jgi:uncharacterized protein YegL
MASEKMQQRIFLLDRSGSMQSCVNDTIGGYNAFIVDQKKLGGSMSLYLFDHEIINVYKDKSIDEVEVLNRDTFVPRGSTALFDAIGETVKTIEIKDDVMISVIILTDGEENCSKKYSAVQIKELINEFTEKGVTFMYLGANQDAFNEATKIGIDLNNVMNYEVDATQDAFVQLSTCMRARSSGINTMLSPTPIPSSTRHKSSIV